MMSSDRIKEQLQLLLLSWFSTHRRPMPWRKTADPYLIWISEVMLQQTQVATVSPYYERFVGQFPSVRSLANASLHDVMKAWEGLGYYSRARHLHAAAKEIMARFNGKVPDDEKALLSLPGIGRYTAGAILSIAYGKAAPILDGNVIRVLTRVFHITDNVDKSSTRRVLWTLAEQLLPQTGVGPFNEAMMELGALVCKAKRPDCDLCPVESVCEARKLHIEEALPFRTPRKPVPHIDVTAGIIWKNSRFLITLRPPKGLLGALWEFPGGKVESGETYESCLKREIREELNIVIEVWSHLISVQHAYTHFRLTLHVFECLYRQGSVQMDPESAVDYRWITIKDLDQYAFPGADRKVIEKLKESRNKNQD
jgi:A/G-specific adenine glycosylase